MDYTINLTDAAIKAVKSQLIKRGTPDAHLRIGLKGSGCSGYSYALIFEDKEPTSRDLLFTFDTVKVVVDPKSIVYLNGATLNWEKSLMKQGYVFSNPNAVSQCGCGESFSI